MSKDFNAAVRELMLLKKLDHKNILKVIDSFQSREKNELIMILEFCPCKSACLFLNVFVLKSVIYLSKLSSGRTRIR